MARILCAILEALEKRRLLSSTAGASDTTFGQHGMASITVPGADFANALDMTLQPDGKILVAGSAELTSGVQDIALARFNADGSPDTTFGTGGIVLTDFSATDAEADRIVLSGTQILVAGDANGDFAVARYNSNGSLDTTFGTGGTTTLDLGSDDDKAFGVAVESNGTIVLDGQSGGQLAVVGLNADGSLDSAFGTSGKTIVDAPGFVPSTDPTADGTGDTLDGSGGVRILNDGELLVVSNEPDNSDTGGGGGRVDFLYFHANGTLDTFDRGTEQDDAPDVVGFAFPGGGKVLTFSSDGTYTLQRYNADATLDSTFGSGGTGGETGGGTATSDLSWGADGTIEPNGQIIVAGTAEVGYSDGVAVERFNANGSVDKTFGQNGIVVSPSAGYDAATAAVDANGNIIAVGSNGYGSDAAFTAVKYKASVGIIPPSATLTSAPALTHSGENQVLLSVTYSSTDGLDLNSLEDGNLTVTQAGGSGDDLATYFLSSTQNADGSTTVVYQVQKDYSGHYFDALDNGTYTVSIGDGVVYDIDGAAVPAATLGTFSINIATPAGGIHGPSGSLDFASITTVDVTDQTLSVTFTSSIGIDANTFDGDLTVTGPDGFNQDAEFQSETSNANGTVTATYDLQHDDAHAVFTSADNGLYTVSIDADAVEDMDGNASLAATLGTFHVAVPKTPGGAGPVATLVAPDLTNVSVRAETFTVTYAAASSIATNTLDGNDLLVTGPNDFSQNATFVSSTMNTDSSVTATYSISGSYYEPLAGATNQTTTTGAATVASAKSIKIETPTIALPPFFGSLANGLYTVSLIAGQVNDLLGHPAASATLGTFTVNRPAEPTSPVSPIFFDPSTISTIADGKSTATDAHHQALASFSASNTKSTPTRTHANLPKHKHKKKKKHVSKQH